MLYIDHLLSPGADNNQGDSFFPPIIKIWFYGFCFLEFIIIKRKAAEKDKVPVPRLHMVLYMHYPQTIVNPLAEGDEYTYR